MATHPLGPRPHTRAAKLAPRSACAAAVIGLAMLSACVGAAHGPLVAGGRLAVGLAELAPSEPLSAELWLSPALGPLDPLEPDPEAGLPAVRIVPPAAVQAPSDGLLPCAAVLAAAPKMPVIEPAAGLPDAVLPMPVAAPIVVARNRRHRPQIDARIVVAEPDKLLPGLDRNARSHGRCPLSRDDRGLTRFHQIFTKTSLIAPLAAARLLHAVLDEPQRSAFAAELEIDVAISHSSGTRFRLNGFTNRAGAAAACRRIPAQVPALEQLGAPPVLRRVAGLNKGLVLVTGPTGSGKSTTLAALIDHINTNANRHILTIEDPIEFVHESKRSLINQREVGRDTRSFARALRSALRADPDVILVGELRDYETIALALTAAETGHLVLATLHTSSAAKTIDRLVDVVPSADKPMVRTMLSSSLQAVVAQTLLRRADGGGRVAAYEILISTAAVANLIRENQIAQLGSMMQTGSRFGMQLMHDAIEALVASRQVDRAEAARVLDALSDEPGPAERDERAAASHQRPGFGFGGLA